MWRSSRFSRSTSATSSRSLARRVSTLPVSERDPLPGIHPPWLGSPSEFDDRIGRHFESGDLVPDPSEPTLRPTALRPEVVERSVQRVHPTPPFFALLHVEQDGFGVDHAGGRGGRGENQPFAPDRGPGSGGRTERLKVLAG